MREASMVLRVPAVSVKAMQDVLGSPHPDFTDLTAKEVTVHATTHRRDDGKRGPVRTWHVTIRYAGQ